MLPILFTLHTPWGAQPIYAYGVLLGVSLIAGYGLLLRIGAREPGMNAELLGNAYIVAALSGVIGARALYVLENRELLEETGARWFAITSGGVSAYGGVLGGLLGVALYLRGKRASLAVFADAAMPSIALGSVLTAIGCYLYGSDFGTPLEENAPAWLKHLGTFPRWHYDELHVFGSPAYLHHVDRYGLLRDASASLPVHPTQLYQALVGVVLLGLALWLRPRRRFAGQVALTAAMVYGIARFGLEYLRDDPERGYAFGYSSAQLISLLFVPLCAVAYSALRGQARRAGQTA
jgi:phosphatidylglycerol:prolipoprotein diacylglycerol transferase